MVAAGTTTMSTLGDGTSGRPRVVVVGGGFGGLQAALKLAKLPVDVTLIDRRNFHLFQPLAYQVATGALSPGEIAYPLRRIFRRRPNVRVLLAEVSDVDLEKRLVHVEPVIDEAVAETVPYDILIVSGGSEYNYFGHDEWRAAAAELKTLEGALAIRSEILAAFEAAELEEDPGRRRSLLTFVVVGAGPTGVEMAGQIAEIARDLRGDFRTFDSGAARILLVEAADRVLGAFPPSLSEKAARSLEDLGVTPQFDRMVIDLDATGVTTQARDGTTERIDAHTVVWAAGVMAARLARILAERAGAEVDRSGRVAVNADLTLPGHCEVFALGDMVTLRQADGSLAALPGLAPVAIQQGRYVARAVAARLAGRPPQRFRYHDKGNLATIGRAKAVADLHGVRLSGFVAWVTWLTVHLWYLIGFENRLLVVIRWAWSFFAHGRGVRLITGEPTGERTGVPTGSGTR
jgi:NADH dehydrogenase